MTAQTGKNAIRIEMKTANACMIFPSMTEDKR